MSMKTRITSNRITELHPDEIFVFGSNLEGAHGGGAAYLAWKKWGAIWGQGTGLQGQTYGIPTMHGGPGAIKPYVDEKFQSWILGVNDFDSEYDSFIKELKARGIDRALEINQKAYETFLGEDR